jgi:hypothetical protein
MVDFDPQTLPAFMRRQDGGRGRALNAPAARPDFRPEQTRLPPAGAAIDHGNEPHGRAVNLYKLEKEMSRSRLDEIAGVVRSLTYGEMIELAEAMFGARGDAEVTKETLPMILHKWSQLRSQPQAA